MHGLLSITVPLKVLINHNIDFGFHPKEIGVILKDFSPRIFMITFDFSKDYLVSSVGVAKRLKQSRETPFEGATFYLCGK